MTIGIKVGCGSPLGVDLLPFGGSMAPFNLYKIAAIPDLLV